MNVAQAVLFIATTCGVATLVEDAVKPQVPSKKLDEFVEKAFGVRGWPEYFCVRPLKAGIKLC